MIKRLVTIAGISMLMTSTAYAKAPAAVENYETEEKMVADAVLGEGTAHDEVHRYGKGEIFSSGVLDITNQKDGSIYLSIETYAHMNVDSIHHTIFLDQWDTSKNTWVQVGSWEFDKTSAEAGGKLSMLQHTITARGYKTNREYRARGLHMVKKDGRSESGSTETHGVLITDK